MPIYQYRETFPDGTIGEAFEVFQKMTDEPLKTHPISGNPVTKCLNTPSINTKYSENTLKQKLDPKNLGKQGFTQYQRDQQTGTYHKTSGSDPRAPETIDPT
jgi:hypothetical protein